MAVTLTRQKEVLVVSGSLDRFNLADPSLYKFVKFDTSCSIDLSKTDNIDTAGLAFLLKLVNFYKRKKNNGQYCWPE